LPRNPSRSLARARNPPLTSCWIGCGSPCSDQGATAASAASIGEPTNGPSAEGGSHAVASPSEKAPSTVEGFAPRLPSVKIISPPTAPPCSCHAARSPPEKPLGRAWLTNSSEHGPPIDIRAARATAAFEKENKTSQFFMTPPHRDRARRSQTRRQTLRPLRPRRKRRRLVGFWPRPPASSPVDGEVSQERRRALAISCAVLYVRRGAWNYLGRLGRSPDLDGQARPRRGRQLRSPGVATSARHRGRLMHRPQLGNRRQRDDDPQRDKGAHRHFERREPNDPRRRDR
jgi:hypothetical protein